ncbi:serine protease [Photobacterium sp. Hal280]
MLFCSRRVTPLIMRMLFCLGCVLLATANTQAALPDVIAKIKPSVVGVGTYNKLATPRANLIGTGFVVGDGTLVATNNHVVPTAIEVDRSTGFVVFVGTGTSPDVRTATVVARDSEHDLALLKITGSPLPSLSLSPARCVKVRSTASRAFPSVPYSACTR